MHSNDFSLDYEINMIMIVRIYFGAVFINSFLWAVKQLRRANKQNNCIWKTKMQYSANSGGGGESFYYRLLPQAKKMGLTAWYYSRWTTGT